MINKKAQGTPQSYISLLIFVTGIALVIYILMLPPSERADLLEQNRTNADDGEKDDITILMSKEPGTLSNIAENEINIDFPSFTLFSRTDTKSVIEFDTIYVKKSLFEEQEGNISFKIDNFDTTENFVLSFTIPKYKGILTIILNGKILTSDEYLTESPPPLRLPKDYLQQNNNLVFKVSGPGVEFWNTNEYLIKNMKITADITDNSGIENKQVFVISEKEKANLESFQLSFIANCKSSEVSPMVIYLNKRIIYSSIPDCGQPTKVSPQDASRIREGENDLQFIANKGFYDIYAVEGKLTLEKPIFPTYYFILDKETYDKIKSGKADLNVSLLFTNSDDKKSGVIYINEYKTEIETFDNYYTRAVNSFVRQGNNAVEIRPKSEKLDILELNILLAE